MSRSRLDPIAPILAIALFGLVCGWAAATSSSEGDAPPADPQLPFAVEQPPGGIPIFSLGINRFTLRQLTEFVAGVDGFLRRAESVAPGAQLAWRIDGLRGYISVSTSPFVDGPEYLLTLRGEPVRTFEDAAALLGTVTRLAVQLLQESPIAGNAGAEGAPGTSVPASLTR